MGDKIDLPKEYEKKIFELSEKTGIPMQKIMEQAIQVHDFSDDKRTPKERSEYLKRIISEIAKGEDSSFYEIFWNPSRIGL
jgi:hypothetical protein